MVHVFRVNHDGSSTQVVEMPHLLTIGNWQADFISRAGAAFRAIPTLNREGFQAFKWTGDLQITFFAKVVQEAAPQPDQVVAA